MDPEEFVMSRLVGRDGFLLPYATNSFHMHQEAQLHRLHHQDPDLEANRETGYTDNENVFFRWSNKRVLLCFARFHREHSVRG